jgi:hypothetical protein
MDGDDLRKLPLSMRKTTLARLLARRPEGIFVNPFEQGEIGPDLFLAACNMGLEGAKPHLKAILMGKQSRFSYFRLVGSSFGVTRFVWVASTVAKQDGEGR